MTSHRIDMRLTGTQEDLEVWLKLVRKMAEHKVVDIIQESRLYPNRNSQLCRIYLQLNVRYFPDQQVEQVRGCLED